ncbi:MAG TPA: S8 family serine peptidase [Thermoanaerobaculia bacterium]|nr:S8 family serine peptidase [Thermoanaerobaculia bacterium]
MHRLSIAFSLALIAAVSFAQETPAPEQRDVTPSFRGFQHVLLASAEPLTDAQRATLAAEGVQIQRAAGSGRLIARIPAGTSLAADGITFEPITAERKINRTARHEAAHKAFAELNVIFHDDVTIDDARALIEKVGGALDDPLQTELSIGNYLTAHVPSSALETLAADDRVLTVVGRLRAKMATDNSTNAVIHHVKELYSAPYNLSGAGVVVSEFELAEAQASHPDFGGRLITHTTGGDPDDASHATHVAGTIIGSGAGNADAKGMAPAATLHEFSARGATADSWLKPKDEQLAPLGVVADNNSWGYVLGWVGTDGDVWQDLEVYFGAYDLIYAAPIDKISRARGVLFVHSAGNEGLQPHFEPPAPHKHVDENLDPIPNKVYCYSADGTGTDCPNPCTPGPEYCELVRHMANAPWTTVGVTASAKNILTVGATDASRNIIGFSSRGPARDGRVKPEVTARGFQVLSTVPTNAYGRKSGTSMASPTVTGIATILTEQWRKTFAGANPLPSQMKALIIASVEEAGPAGPDYTYGFGFPNAKTAADLVIADSAAGNRIRTASIQQGGTYEVPVTLTAAQNFRVVLNWADPEIALIGDDDIAATALVNDLDVKVIDPSGNTVLPYVLDKDAPTAPATRGVNHVDPTEMIDIANAAAGTYRVVVTGSKVTEGPQQFVLIANAQVGQTAPPACTDATEPNDASAPYGNIGSDSSVSAAICDATDVDVFRFQTTKAGTVSVVVTATGTPLRATLTVGNTTVIKDVGTSSSQTLTAAVGGGATNATVRIEAAGALGDQRGYTVTPSYPFAAGPRTRSVRH